MRMMIIKKPCYITINIQIADGYQNQANYEQTTRPTEYIALIKHFQNLYLQFSLNNIHNTSS